MNAAQKADVLAVLDEMSSFMQISYPHYDSDEKLRAVRDAVAELIEAGNTLRQIQMHSAPWYERGIRQDYARRVGVSEASSRRMIEEAAADRFDAALANIGSAP